MLRTALRRLLSFRAERPERAHPSESTQTRLAEMEQLVDRLERQVRQLRRDAEVERSRVSTSQLIGMFGVMAFVFGVVLPLGDIDESAAKTAEWGRQIASNLPYLLLTAVSIGPLVAGAWRYLRPRASAGTDPLVSDLEFVAAHALRLGLFVLIVGAPAMHLAELIDRPFDTALRNQALFLGLFFWVAAVCLDHFPQAAARKVYERSSIPPTEWPLEFQD